MSLDIGAALRNGLSRTVQRNGLLLVVAFLVVGLVTTVATQSFNAALPGALPGNGTNATAVPGGPLGGDGGQATPLALPIPLGVAAVAALAMLVVTEAVRIVSVRTLVSDETRAIPGEFVRRNIGLATLNGLLGSLVVGVLVAIGLVLLIVPGLFLAVAFFFVRQEIAVEDKNFVDAMTDSWALTKGDRIEVFVLALVVVVVDVAASLPGVALAVLDPLAGALASTVVGAVTTVFGIAVAARAYDQLRTEREEGEEEVGALGPDDLEEPAD